MKHYTSLSRILPAAAIFALAACNGGSMQTRGGANGAIPNMPAQSATQSQSFAQTGSTSAFEDGTAGTFNQNGNVLIADQFNNRVIEVNPNNHKIVWEFSGVLGTNDAERIPGGNTLIAGTSVPASNPPFEPGCAAGCADNRVLIAAHNGKILWQYGVFGTTGSGPNRLNTPVQSTYLPNGDVLISDQGNQRVIEVNKMKQIVWQYGTTGVAGIGSDQLNNPNSAELLADGTILISDEANNRVIQVTRAKQIIWQYPVTLNTSKLNGAAFASRLSNGNTLITDSNNNRVIEVDKNRNLVWQYSTLATGGNANPLPTRAVRLMTGETLISDQFNDRVINVQKTGASSGAITFTQGVLNLPGNTFDHLNAPYDAKVIGDYTGLTHP